MTEESAEDERDVEFSSIQAIFPELLLDSSDSHAAELTLKIAPTQNLPLLFEPPPTPVPPPQLSLSISLNPSLDNAEDVLIPAQPRAHRPPETHLFNYLPSLHLHIVLPDGYPDDSPPFVKISSHPDWIAQQVLEDLQNEIIKLWDEYGRSQVVFAYIDYLQQQAESAFVEAGQPSILPHELKQPMLEFDRLEKKRRFEIDTFDCGVCLEPKKGSSCYRMRSCEHVFCTVCLQDFYNSAITEGDIDSVKCLAPDCGKEKDAINARATTKKPTLHPTELLEIPIDRDQVQRYVDIKRKKKFESDKSTIYCPRQFCQAPARSAKFAKYETATIENFPDSDSESEAEPDPAATDPPADADILNAATSKAPVDRLSICSKCEYAFCRICQRSWHGDFLNCLPPSAVTAKLSAEDKASYEYIRLNTSPCPTCEAPCQKTHGCNHMRCFTCNTHFCYLCSAWLLPYNPYEHFNTRGSGCYMRLWELEEGDEGQGRDVFGGPRAAEQAAIFAAQFEDNGNAQNNIANRNNNNNNNNNNINNRPPRPERRNARPDANGNAEQALQRFLRMAAADEEDGWDSDDMEFIEEAFGI